MTHPEPNPLLAAIQRVALEAEQARVLREVWQSLSPIEKFQEVAKLPARPPTRHRLRTPAEQERSWERSKQRNSAHSAVRRARKVGAHAEHVNRAAIIARDDSTCYLCGKRCRPDEIHLDHIVPLARGGAHRPDNLAVACAKCNTAKGTRMTTLRPAALRGIVPPMG